jgi:hypothetical protein
MSTQFPASVFETRSSTNRAVPPRDWRREPLLHFILVGALLFGIDHVIAGRADDPRTIVVGPAVDAEAKQLFQASRNREPTPEELDALRRVWLDNEVLYREGIAMQMDKGDTTIRDRVIFKALSMIDANVKLPPVDDAKLRAWFEAHRAKYDEPGRVDFQEAVLAGTATEAQVRAFVADLNAGTPGDAKAGLRVFKGRPHANLVQSYGEIFANALENAPPGQWQALKTREGWRAVKLDSKSAAKPASFENMAGVVMQDWKDAAAAEQRTAAVRALQKKYTIKSSSAP